MTRGIGEIDLLHGLLPEWSALGLGVVTQLGDIWLLALLLVALYWRRPARRPEIAALGGVWLAGIGLYRGLKEVFALPRPTAALLAPEAVPVLVRPLYEATAFATGYGFPSGHAVGTTIVYGGLAAVLTVRTARVRFVAAGTVVATVSFTRVALGLHYLVDVLAGVVVGGALLLATAGLARATGADEPTLAFGLGVGFAVFYLGASGGTWEAVLLGVVAVCALLAWRLRDSLFDR